MRWKVAAQANDFSTDAQLDGLSGSLFNLRYWPRKGRKMERPWRSVRSEACRWLNWRRSLPQRFDTFKEWLSTSNVAPERRERLVGLSSQSEIESIDFDTEISHLEISLGSGSGVIEFPSDLKVRSLRISNADVDPDKATKDPPTSPNGERPTLRFVNSLIQELDVRPSAAARISLVRCYVRRISLHPLALEDLNIENGALLGLSAPVSHWSGQNPFRGRVTIKDLYLPRNFDEIESTESKDGLAKAIYEFRNIRTLLAAKNDALAAGLFHGAELALERKGDSYVSQVASWGYEFFADFGNSLARPAFWTSFTILASIAYAAVLDAVEIGAEVRGYGWPRELALPERWGLRASVYSLQAIFNPLGLLNSRPLLVPTEPAHAVVLGAFSLMGTLAIFLLALSIRRRFKLDRGDTN